MPKRVTSDWIVHAITRGRTAERIEAQRLLEDAGVGLDRNEVRSRLLDVLNRELAPDRSDLDEGGTFVRGWVLGALGRVPSSEGEPEQTLLRHIDRTREPSFWNRYWAFEALLRHVPRATAGSERFQPSQKLLEACQKISDDPDEDPLPKRLAGAILAGAGGRAERKRLTEIVEILREDPKDAAVQADLWATLRALRFVYLPSVIEDLIRVVERQDSKGKPVYDDFTYDALVALGNVPPNSKLAESGALALIRFIYRIRDFQFWDAFRMRAIESLGRLRHAHARPLLVEELADYNPGVAREAALALESIVGAGGAAVVVLDEAARANADDRVRLARGLREMRDRDAVVDALGRAMTSRDSEAQRDAQALLSEVGGVGAFDKLRSLTESTEEYLKAMKGADEQLRRLFERTMLEARIGIGIAAGMDVVMFVVGLVLLGIAVRVALVEQNRFGALTGLITGAGGVVSVIVGRFYAKPREKIQESVHYLTGVKAIFLGYLRQLHQTDQAYTRRVLEGTPLSIEETGKFNDLVDRTMTKALEHLATKPATEHDEQAIAKAPQAQVAPAAPDRPAAADPPAP